MKLTCGGVGVEPLRPPDIISSVMSRPPWLGSLILICGGEGRDLLLRLANNELKERTE